MDTGAGSVDLTVRTVVDSDLPAVVGVHQTAFKGFFLDRMGPRFLQAYYKSVLDYKNSIFLVSVDDAANINGFAVGFIDPDAFYAHFRAQRRKLMPIILKSLMMRPWLFMAIARNTRRLADTDISGDRLVELSSIGTSKRGAGIGKVLLNAFCRRCTELGADRVRLTTDRDDNIPVLNFYLSQGFESLGIEQRGKRVLQIMTKDLSATRT